MDRTQVRMLLPPGLMTRATLRFFSRSTYLFFLFLIYSYLHAQSDSVATKVWIEYAHYAFTLQRNYFIKLTSVAYFVTLNIICFIYSYYIVNRRL